ncbi:nitroreductase family protein [uncultured Propionibacterium sp.]|uniref:nitroreductase family protein n=1 Tax=uncultured Propionibacterium sp. TaxID=218066 RepID=UPI00292F4FF4|nr:nitroreductase family protein [uncultured Propionibacterium sp.]
MPAEPGPRPVDAPSEALSTAPTAAVANETITTQLAHRTIRRFSGEPLGADLVETLVDVARHAATSNFQQQSTIIHVVAPRLRAEMFASCGYPDPERIHGELFVFVVDLHRNAVIRARAGADPEPLERVSLFLQGCEDVLIGAQNMVVAAESLGLGTRYLGALLGDPRRVIRALGLPSRTFPLVGLLVGHPAERPQFKPRMPRALSFGTDAYPAVEGRLGELAEFDETVQEYYDLRDTNRRVDSFSDQIATVLGKGPWATSPLLEILHEQGLALH